MIGFDYTERIDPAALKAAGCRVVFRYLSKPGWPKNLTAPEARELLAAGIPVVLNFETTADFMLGGYAAGVACARSARAQADVLGAPRSARIWYSADFEATAEQLAAVLDFGRGAASVDGHNEVGVYGGLRVALAEEAAGFPVWQTVAWSGGRWDPRAVARQTGAQQVVGGVRVDVNQIVDLVGLGAWGGPSVGGVDMQLTDTVQVTAGFAQRYPATGPDGFTAGAQIPVSTLLLGAAIRDANTEHLLAGIAKDIAALAGKVGQPPTVDVAALAAAIDVQALSADLAAHMVASPDYSPDSLANTFMAHLSARLSGGAS